MKTYSHSIDQIKVTLLLHREPMQNALYQNTVFNRPTYIFNAKQASFAWNKHDCKGYLDFREGTLNLIEIKYYRYMSLLVIARYWVIVVDIIIEQMKLVKA